MRRATCRRKTGICEHVRGLHITQCALTHTRTISPEGLRRTSVSVCRTHAPPASGAPVVTFAAVVPCLVWAYLLGTAKTPTHVGSIWCVLKPMQFSGRPQSAECQPVNPYAGWAPLCPPITGDSTSQSGGVQAPPRRRYRDAVLLRPLARASRRPGSSPGQFAAARHAAPRANQKFACVGEEPRGSEGAMAANGD